MQTQKNRKGKIEGPGTWKWQALDMKVMRAVNDSLWLEKLLKPNLMEKELTVMEKYAPVSEPQFGVYYGSFLL